VVSPSGPRKLGPSADATQEREAKILGIIETARGKRAKFRDAHVTMAHGAGGKATQGLIEGLFLPAFGSPELDALGDAGIVGELALTTDSFVVTPLRFPGGSIGELAVNGTVNDLAVAGARPLALSLSLVLEEGLPSDDLRAEVVRHRKARRFVGLVCLMAERAVGAVPGRHDVPRMQFVDHVEQAVRIPEHRRDGLPGAPHREHVAQREVRAIDDPV